MKKIVLSYIGLLLFLIIVDLASKSMAVSGGQYILNSGFVFGSFSKSPIEIRVVSLACMSGFVFFIYILTILFSSIKMPRFKWGATFLMSGIFGNIFDRVWRGATVDFINPLPDQIDIYFNVADIYLVAGAILLIHVILRHEDKIWHPENVRQTYLINPKDQIRFALKMVLISFCSVFLLGLFSLSYWKMVTYENGLPLTAFTNYLFVYFAITLAFLLIVFFIGLVLSHRTAGPLYAFENYVEKLLVGDRSTLKLRDGDNYRHFEEVAEKLKSYFESQDKKIEK